jgi:hypothetical protein
LLCCYLRGEIGSGRKNGDENGEGEGGESGGGGGGEGEGPTPVNEPPRPRQNLPPVLAPLEEAGPLLLASASSLPLEERVPRMVCVERVSTSPAWSLRFWGKAGFRPVAMEEEEEEEGEGEGEGGREGGGQGHRAAAGATVVRMALGLVDEDAELQARMLDFQTRVLRLLPSLYSGLGVCTALGLVGRPEHFGQSQQQHHQQQQQQHGEEEEEAAAEDGPEGQGHHRKGGGRGGGGGGGGGGGVLSAEEQAFLFTGHDLRRLEMYARALVDHGMVADLLPLLGLLFFQGRLHAVARLPSLQQAVLLGLGMQRKPLDLLAREVQLPPHQVLALFNKAMRRLSGALQAIQEAEVEREMEASRRLTIAAAGSKVSLARAPEAEGGHASLPVRLEEEMEAGAKESLAEMGMKRRRDETQAQAQALRGLDMELMQYAVKGSAEDWEAVLRSSKGALDTHGMVQIQSTKEIADPSAATYGLPTQQQEEDRRLGRKVRKGRMEGAVWDVEEGGRKGGKQRKGGSGRGGGGRRR